VPNQVKAGAQQSGYQPELEAALAAAHLAGEAILSLYESFVAIPDAPSTISTEADRQSQERILQYLSRRFPGEAFRAEEQTPTLAVLPGRGPRLWVIDPIDGTRGFARKNGEFSVMIALLDQGQMAVGVVAEPVKGRLTYAVRGGGCWKRDGGQPAVPCRVSATAALAQAVVTQSHSRNPAVPNKYVQALRPVRVVETYSAGIKLALVARGEADLYLNDYDAMHDWDLCAGHILVAEAGGTVTTLYGEPLTYGSEDNWHRRGVLASNGLLHPLALQKLPS
jgi:3'(2'), 5'-bisphosphate nucleotidase